MRGGPGDQPVGRSDGPPGRSPTARPPHRLSALQCPDGSPPPCARATPRPAPTDRTPSLTVLYLENASPDTQDVALADGITEELIARLSQVTGLKVTGRYGALRYRGQRNLDPRLVGREMGVRYVLQGTLRQAPSGCASPWRSRT